MNFKVTKEVFLRFKEDEKLLDGIIDRLPIVASEVFEELNKLPVMSTFEVLFRVIVELTRNASYIFMFDAFSLIINETFDGMFLSSEEILT